MHMNRHNVAVAMWHAQCYFKLVYNHTATEPHNNRRTWTCVHKHCKLFCIFTISQGRTTTESWIKLLSHKFNLQMARTSHKASYWSTSNIVYLPINIYSADIVYKLKMATACLAISHFLWLVTVILKLMNCDITCQRFVLLDLQGRSA